MSQPTIVMIPGLGADRELFYPQQQHFSDQLHVVKGPASNVLWQQQPSMSLAADAYLNHIETLIAPDRDYLLGGMSFGGSLAIEIARRIMQTQRLHAPKAITLIASNRTSDSISRGFRINRAIGSKLPRSLVRRSLRTLSGIFAAREKLETHDRSRLREMAIRANLEQLMWGAKAIAMWSCTDEDAESLAIPIHQIHGRGDWVIPFRSQHVTTTVDDGRHLITWTHRDQINEWLAAIASGL